jgi:transcriptional regulator GlxA family with amidase domain
VRHLSRLFEEQVGMTAGQYVEHVRVEAVKVHLETSDEGLVTVARLAGFKSAETMRRAFLRDVGTSPGAYRARFRTTGVTDGRTPRRPTVRRVPVSRPVHTGETRR